VPVVVNTSFNDNEPIVCKPEEAIDCFLRTRMDSLVMGNLIVRRKTPSPMNESSAQFSTRQTP
jgi:carbamoyltransferase